MIVNICDCDFFFFFLPIDGNLIKHFCQIYSIFGVSDIAATEDRARWLFIRLLQTDSLDVHQDDHE